MLDRRSVSLELRNGVLHEVTRDRWVVETAERALERIERFDDPANEYAQMARDQYGDVLSTYREATIMALESLEDDQAD